VRAVPDATLAARARAPRRLLAGLLLALAAMAPTVAYSFTLTQLLQMPLERLLQLHIEAR
jgi:hypothetical protein